MGVFYIRVYSYQESYLGGLYLIVQAASALVGLQQVDHLPCWPGCWSHLLRSCVTRLIMGGNVQGVAIGLLRRIDGAAMSLT